MPVPDYDKILNAMMRGAENWTRATLFILILMCPRSFAIL